ncbi:MAG: carboxypeptidase regulatory-like domain-containing protein [Candidatus Eremiobacteraeota bacterium]|nr:carboxypeptidase regulatory-like domain-containing protein [Candidatus Eremiobacteraeota bacterium]
MNCTGIFATALLVGVILAGPAGAQEALVVGSVRDQHGAAVEGAEVAATARNGSALPPVVSDASGTFAIRAAGVGSVTVTCRYCAQRTIAVMPGQPVVAIVRRFDALFADSPSPSDLANLPYAHVESSLALRPFSLLRQTTGVLPGSQLSDRGLAPANALLVDAGVPNYDVVLGTSPYDTIPAAYAQSGDITTAADAFAYGDRASSGIVSVQPFGDDDADVALTGSDQILRLQDSSDAARLVAATFSNGSESRQRSDLQVNVPLSSAQTVSLNGGTSQDHEYGNAYSTFGDNFTFANAVFDDAQPTTDLHASFIADRGDYVAGEGGLPLSDVWSDADFTAGVRTRGPLSAFADVSNRLSTGIYDATSYLMPRIGGTLTQNRVDAGIDLAGNAYDVAAGIGFFGVDYTGGSDGTSVPSSGHLATPSLRVALFPNEKWSAVVDASGSFTLPNLWQQYGPTGGYQGLVYDRNSLYSALLSYTDASRIRIAVEAASQHVNGFTNGFVTSDGASIAWQIAPTIALRAWTMRVADTTAPTYANPYYPAGFPSNVNAVWLTYDNFAALRVDAIYRQDVLDRAPFEHFDGDVSGPINGRLRWYAGVEDRQRTTYLDAGIRIGGP